MKPRTIRSVMLVLQSTAAGGMETHVIDLAGEYRRRGIAVRVMVPAAAIFDGIAERCEANDATVLRLTSDSRNGRAAQAVGWWRLVCELRRAKPDAVHLHTGGATGGLAVLATARLFTRATVVITEHDVPVERPTRVHVLSRRLVDRASHAVVAVSRRNARLRQERLPMRCRNFAAVLNGVVLPAAPPDERAAAAERVRAEQRLGRDDVVIGSLVRLAEGKGIDTLLRAFALVRANHECHLLLVGDGPLRTGLEQMAAELGVAADVTFAGNQAAPAPFLDAMDVFALAVPAGSMSIALLEAMARGVAPVITFCGPEEAVIPGETGLGAEPNDPRALADALSSLVANPARRAELGRAAAQHVAIHFSVERVADDLLEIYALGPSGPLPPRLAASSPPNPRPGLAQHAQLKGFGNAGGG